MQNTPSTHRIFGLHAIMEAIRSQEPIDKVFLQKGLKGELFQQLETLVRKNGITTSYVPLEKLERMARGNHQGAVAQVSPVSFVALETLVENTLAHERPALFLLLDQISDVRNFGAIIRTAECTGVSGIIIPESGSAPISGDTIKTSAGAVFHVPIAKVPHIKDAVFYLQASGIPVIAATEKAEHPLYDLDLKESCAFVMGAEGRGISPSILKVVDHKAKLPLLGQIGSLNVSVACAVFLYETVRQRQLP